MKERIRPQPGYALLQIVKEDFTKRGPTEIIPIEGKDSTFFNRMKIIALGPKRESTAISKLDHRIRLEVGDIVIMSGVGAQTGVPGDDSR